MFFQRLRKSFFLINVPIYFTRMLRVVKNLELIGLLDFFRLTSYLKIARESAI